MPLRLACLCLALLTACAAEPARDFRAEADFVIVGEVHGVPEHHATQARIAAEMQPAAIVFEQIDSADTALVNGLLANGADAATIADRLAWDETGWPDFALYHQIMLAAPDALIVGGGASRADVRRARQEGAAAAFGANAARYGLDSPLPAPERAIREQLQIDVHCGAIPARLASGFVEAQRFRDARLAEAVLLAWERTDNRRVLLVTGNGHARVDYGVPALLDIATPALRSYSIGQVGEGDSTPFNEVIVTPLPAGSDPCDGLNPVG
ncbi:ChaN family lipoprotein [Roseobacter sp. HKCCA0434]|uniref:ChaN family lipoprotein n=1 Tax=Roseobacter sp. HKCCA0434 TaxID=3079297 RepID=UPI002905DEB9|nr:ChaN family lipoprotein [Roseobacter sp. HKCCA0434]